MSKNGPHAIFVPAGSWEILTARTVTRLNPSTFHYSLLCPLALCVAAVLKTSPALPPLPVYAYLHCPAELAQMTYCGAAGHIRCITLC